MRHVLAAVLAAITLGSTAVHAQGKPEPSARRVGALAVAGTAAVQRIDLVTVNGMDYAFALPGTIRAGTVTFNLVNTGQDVHALTLLQLPDNHTLRDFLDLYHRGGIIPAWMVTLGQTPTVAPRQEAFLTARLKPGRYVLACLIPSRDGRAHTEKGMVQPFSVQ